MSLGRSRPFEFTAMDVHAWKRNPSRSTVARRATTTRHELNMQLPPDPVPLDPEVLAQYVQHLSRIQGCVYCGKDATTQDHLHALVSGGIPCGLVPTQVEMVPCCARCNSAKGSRTWQWHMARLVEKNRHAEDHSARIAWLESYDRWRKSHEQRWDAESHRRDLSRLKLLVDDCHAYMQTVVNQAVASMHGSRARQFRAPPLTLNWDSITQQLDGYPESA